VAGSEGCNEGKWLATKFITVRVRPGFVWVLFRFCPGFVRIPVSAVIFEKTGRIMKKPEDPGGSWRTPEDPGATRNECVKTVQNNFRIFPGFVTFRVFAVNLEKSGMSRTNPDKTWTKPGRTRNYPEGFAGSVYYTIIVPHSPVPLRKKQKEAYYYWLKSNLHLCNQFTRPL
jgi:hypothetical protein